MKTIPAAFEICVTIGPASCDPAVMRQLIEAGARAFRFPFAKETPAWQVAHADMVRSVGSEIGIEVATVMDLPGSEPRTRNDTPLQLVEGQQVLLSIAPHGVDVEGLASISLGGADGLLSLSPGDLLLIGDGEVALSTLETGTGVITARVLNAGIVMPRRPVTAPRSTGIGDVPSPTDITLLSHLRDHAFTRVMLSFARSASEVESLRSEMRAVLGDSGRLPLIETKIETTEALSNIQAIAMVTDHLLIARGHLALHVGVLDFYSAQRAVIAAAHKVGRPVHAGTQLLETAATRWVPSRAELSDLSHLVAAGIDGVLLSAETTVGLQPVRTVEFVRQIASHYGGLR